MQKIVITACFIGVAITISEAIAPSEKYLKQIRLIFSAIFLLGVITPIASEGFTLDIFSNAPLESSTTYMAVNGRIDDYMKKSVEFNIENSLREILIQNNIETKKISVTVNIIEDNSIDISEVSIDCNNYEMAEEIVNLHLGDNVKVNEYGNVN